MATPRIEVDPSDINAAIAMRAIQQYDEAVRGHEFRHLLIRALDALGDELGLECTGEVDGWDEEGHPSFYKHNGETCPIHEWLVQSDAAEIHEALRFSESEKGEKTDE